MNLDGPLGEYRTICQMYDRTGCSRWVLVLANDMGSSWMAHSGLRAALNNHSTLQPDFELVTRGPCYSVDILGEAIRSSE